MSFNIFEIIEPSVRNYPDRPAILTPRGEEISYRRLAEIVDSFAAHAAYAGISKGDNVILRVKSKTAHLCMILALSKLGAVRLPALDPDAAGAWGLEVNHVITDSSQALTGPNVIRVDRTWLAGSAAAASTVPMDGFETKRGVAIVMPSSGTTGRPKLLSFDLELISQAIDDQCSQMGVLSGRTLLLVPPTLVYGLEMALLTLRSGGTIIWSRKDFSANVSLLKKEGIDDIIAAPLAYSHFVDYFKSNGIKLRSIKRAHMAGSVASRYLIESMQEYICQTILNNYGSSELGPCASSNVDDIASVPNAVGKLVPWMDVRIVDDHGNALPRGETGQLQFRIKPARRIARYVAKSPDAASPDNDWFIPGDIGTVTENGILCIKGRVTDLINVGGNKIAPSHIEEIATRFLGATEMVCAFGLPGLNGFDEVHVAIDVRNAHRVNDLKAHFRRTNKPLGEVFFKAIKEFPLNDFGKIDRNRLRDMVAAGTDRS